MLKAVLRVPDFLTVTAQLFTNIFHSSLATVKNKIMLLKYFKTCAGQHNKSTL